MASRARKQRRTAVAKGRKPGRAAAAKARKPKARTAAGKARAAAGKARQAKARTAPGKARKPAKRAVAAGAARVVLMTAPVEGARSLARTLVAERLAACVNVVGDIHSLYRWQGEVQEDAEVLLVAKTDASRLPALVGRVVEIHPYELPEVVAVPVVGGSAPYLAWLAAESQG